MKRSFSQTALDVPFPSSTSLSTTTSDPQILSSPRKRQTREGLDPQLFAQTFLDGLESVPEFLEECKEVAENARCEYKVRDLDVLEEQGMVLEKMKGGDRRLANNRRSARGTKVFDAVLLAVRQMWTDEVVKERDGLRERVCELEEKIALLQQQKCETKTNDNDLEDSEEKRNLCGNECVAVEETKPQKNVHQGDTKNTQHETEETQEATDADGPQEDENPTFGETKNPEAEDTEKAEDNEETKELDPLCLDPIPERLPLKDSQSMLPFDPLNTKCSEEADMEWLGFLGSSSQNWNPVVGGGNFVGLSLSQGLV